MEEQKDEIINDDVDDSSEEVVEETPKEVKTDKEMNFEKVRKRLDENEQTIKDLKSQLADKKETEAGDELSKYRDDLLSEMVGDDDKVKEKALFHYNRIKVESKTKEEVKNALEDALILAKKDARTPNPIQQAAAANTSLPTSPSPSASGNRKVAPEIRDFGRKFGLTNEDFDNYEKRR